MVNVYRIQRKFLYVLLLEFYDSIDLYGGWAHYNPNIMSN